MDPAWEIVPAILVIALMAVLAPMAGILALPNDLVRYVGIAAHELQRHFPRDRQAVARFSQVRAERPRDGFFETCNHDANARR